ncbi:IS256 family transposase, partial [Corynebacterium striatum]
ALFRAFIQHLTAGTSLAAIAGNMSCSTRTLQRKFDAFWLVDVRDPTIGHTGRVYDQIFIDGTYTAGGCLIVAATLDHVIAWHWCK